MSSSNKIEKVVDVKPLKVKERKINPTRKVKTVPTEVVHLDEFPTIKEFKEQQD